MFENIPDEMKIYKQWVTWRYEEKEDSDKPTKVPYSALTNKLASVNRPETWCSFDQAVNAVRSGNGFYDGLGFVLTDQDPYAFIDLDDTKGDQNLLNRQLNIYNEFQSYAERSPSGKGLHIIVKADLHNGRKRSSIEVYSNLRFMTMTGDTYRAAPIAEYNDLLNALWLQMAEGKNAAAFYAGLEYAKNTDEQILEIANRAENAEKFHDLFYNGFWQKYYPSQSEADFALINIIAFYSENAAQTQRIFLTSKLAEREKSRAQYRINYMLNRCFDRMLPPVDVEGLRNQLNAALEAKIKKPEVLIEEQDLSHIEKTFPKPEKDVYSVPPGLVGDIAMFIYEQAPRPVPEIALAGAIGFLSGIVGRAYNVSGTGLNHYVLLLAATGTGKEAIAKGVDKLIGAVTKTVPAAIDFLGPGGIASGQAALKHMSKGHTSFVSIVGEVGSKLAEMGLPNKPPHVVSLLNFLLDVFNKSGEGQVLAPTVYADREKNTSGILSPAFSMIGETAPEPFYEGLHEGMIANGFLPRFTVIEYLGKRVPTNPNHMLAKPSFELIDKLATICSHALMLNSQNKAINVQIAPDAKVILDDFDRHCDDNINSADKEIRRHLWNRAHIKVLKLAALIAVGCNPYDPCINVDVATWALNLIVADVRNMLAKFDTGEIGIDNDETKQLSQIIRIVKDYLTSPWSEVGKYKSGTLQLHSERIIPYSYLHKRLSQIGVFRKDRLGTSTAIKRSLKTLSERGDIQEVSRATLVKDFNTTAVCYMVSNLKVFGI